MLMTPGDAARALREIDAAETRVSEATAYRDAGPHLILWGLIWATGYGATGIFGISHAGWMWLMLVTAGSTGSFALGERARRKALGRLAGRAHPATPAIVALLIGIFFFSAFTVFGTSDTNAVLVFPALVTGLIYAVMGLARMQRMMWIGAAIMILSLAGYLWLAPYLAFWIAAVGGIGVVLSGVWLRTA